MVIKMSEKTLVIVNGHTAKLQLRIELLDILDILTKGGLDCTTHPTQRAGDAAEAARQAAEEYSRIVCIGGDGTLSEVTNGLMGLPEEKRPVIGYIPAGTTNDFAASLGLPADPREAAKRIAKGSPRFLDCGRLSGIRRSAGQTGERSAGQTGERSDQRSGEQPGEKDSHIFNYIASFGAFTEASWNTPQQLKNMFGHFAYVVEGLRHPGIEPYHIRFTADGEEIEGDFTFGAVSNTLSIGGVLRLAPEEVGFDDGLHEYLLIRMPENPGELNEIGHELLRRDFGRMVLFGRGSRMTIDCGGLAWSLDGELVRTEGKVEIENLPRAYRLIV